jgi:glyoxylase-like metal-dependent hydrolase (beta-lactamase superfamily II)
MLAAKARSSRIFGLRFGVGAVVYEQIRIRQRTTMDIITLTVGVFDTNCYLVFDRKSREGIIIDPGHEADRIAGEVEWYGFTPLGVVLTHAHGDHIGAVGELKATYGVPVIAGKGAGESINSSNRHFAAMFGIEVSCPDPDHFLEDGDTVAFGGEKLTVIPTPGHSPEGICLHSGKILFCGDTLFYGSVGRTDLPGGDHKQLIDSITQRLLVLSDDTVCYPGHGPTTTIGQERKYNPFLTGGYFD